MQIYRAERFKNLGVSRTFGVIYSRPIILWLRTLRLREERDLFKVIQEARVRDGPRKKVFGCLSQSPLVTSTTCHPPTPTGPRCSG